PRLARSSSCPSCRSSARADYFRLRALAPSWAASSRLECLRDDRRVHDIADVRWLRNKLFFEQERREKAEPAIQRRALDQRIGVPRIRPLIDQGWRNIFVDRLR